MRDGGGLTQNVVQKGYLYLTRRSWRCLSYTLTRGSGVRRIRPTHGIATSLTMVYDGNERDRPRSVFWSAFRALRFAWSIFVIGMDYVTTRSARCGGKNTQNPPSRRGCLGCPRL